MPNTTQERVQTWFSLGTACSFLHLYGHSCLKECPQQIWTLALHGPCVGGGGLAAVMTDDLLTLLLLRMLLSRFINTQPSPFHRASYCWIFFYTLLKGYFTIRQKNHLDNITFGHAKLSMYLSSNHFVIFFTKKTWNIIYDVFMKISFKFTSS